jgi:DNA-binding SARP family transcriptional activator
MREAIVLARVRVPTPTGLRRVRLNALLDAAWQVPLTVVVAPAGSGKTTMLAMFALAQREAGHTVTWYQAAMSEADPARFLHYVEGAIQQVAPSLSGEWDTVDKAAAALEAARLPRLLVVVDDAHTLRSTEAEGALENLITYLPPDVHVVVAGRQPPAFDLPRWRLARQILEIGPDDLRFRSWEVEELFAQHYGEPLAPEEVAELARRTGGWAAGLSLFHLATANRSASERRRLLSSMSSRALDMRDYLTHNVLATLDAGQKDFLVRTCVLGRLSGPWCDELLGVSGSARQLEDLARRHLFLVSHDGGNTYQEHEVLRSFLEELLLDKVGEQGARALYAKAGAVLEAGGAPSEALHAYCRAQDWPAADRLLGLSGDRVVDPLGPWADALPPAVADHDAWYLLAIARRQVRTGHWNAALESYRRAEEAATGALVRQTCQRERFQLAGWVDPGSTVPHDWTGVLRKALARNPLGVLGGPQPRSSGDHLAYGLAAVAAGHMARGRAILTAGGDGPEDTSALQGCAAVVLFLSARLSGSPSSVAIFHSGLNSIDPYLPPWIGRLFHATVGPPASLLQYLEASREEAMAAENMWVDLVFGLVEGCFLMAANLMSEAIAQFDETAQVAISVDAPVLAAWAGAAAALAALGSTASDALPRAVSADQLARSVGCPGASALALLVEAAARGDPNWRSAAAALELEGVVPMANLVGHFSAPLGGEATRRVVSLAEEGPEVLRGPVVAKPAPVPLATGTEVRCLGPFALTIGGRQVDAGVARPRVRALLHYLAIQAGGYVHRDSLCAALWPNDETRTATHGLQVAVSALRQLFENQAGTGAGAIIGRKGESYALAIGGEAHDLARLEKSLEQGRLARHNGHNAEAVAALRTVTALYRGDLLEDAGTAEWVLAPRERYRLMASEASQLLAESLLDLGEAAKAAEAASWGLGIDRYCDGLWKVMIAAHDLGSNQAASARTRSDYQRVLAELGIAEDHTDR